MLFVFIMSSISEISRFSAKQTPTADKVVVCGVIGPTSLSQIQTPCPCCNRSPLVQEGRQTLDEPSSPGKRQDVPCLFNCDEGEEYDGTKSDEEEDDDYLPGVLDSGVEYKFKRVLAEGWVNKKGTGKDIFGSRAFKSRWARLVVSTVP